MSEYPPTTITVNLPHFDAMDITNSDRAAMVEPLLRAFAEAYYHGDYEPGEPLADYMVGDFLADFMHWCDHHATVDGDGESFIGCSNHYFEMASGHYDEEVAEARLNDEGD